MKQRNDKNGSKNNEWETPDYVFNKLHDEFQFNFDLCATLENAKVSTYTSDALNYDPHEAGLNIWCNPPYSFPIKDKIIKKCYELSLHDHVNVVVMLIPAATETRAFHDIIWKYADEIRLIDTRIRFKGYNTKGEYVENATGQSGSMIVVFRNISNPWKKKIMPFVTTDKYKEDFKEE